MLIMVHAVAKYIKMINDNLKKNVYLAGNCIET